MTVHEPIDLLLSCVRQVLLLAHPRDRQIPDSVLEMPIGDTTPSLLRAAGASQQHGPVQVNLSDLDIERHNDCVIVFLLANNVVTGAVTAVMSKWAMATMLKIHDSALPLCL